MSKKLKSASAVDDAVDTSNNKINSTNMTDENNTDNKETSKTTPNKTIKVPAEPTIENTKSSGIIPFWIENPNILFDGTYMFEFFPVDTMTYETKIKCCHEKHHFINNIQLFNFEQYARLNCRRNHSACHFSYVLLSQEGRIQN